MKLKTLLLCVCLSGATIDAHAQAVESYSEKDCKRADGHSTSLLKLASEGIGVPERSIKFEGSFIGGPTGGCAGLFSTPKGPYECSLTAYTTNGGKTFFVGPPSVAFVAGMSNLCRKAK